MDNQHLMALLGLTMLHLTLINGLSDTIQLQQTRPTGDWSKFSLKDSALDTEEYAGNIHKG